MTALATRFSPTEALRRTLYGWLTRRRNEARIGQLRQWLQGSGDVIVVHQMGRAASMTVTNTLRALDLDAPVCHTHWLNPATVADRVRRLERRGIAPRYYPMNIRMSRILARDIEERPGAHRWRIVSVIRDPVARNVSAFFLDIDRFIDDFHARYAKGRLSHEAILDVFLRDYPHDIPLRWFDEEVRDVFGVDVYEHPFPCERGYRIIRQGNVELLVVKLERLDDSIADACRELFGVRTLQLRHTHITERDPARPMYRDFVDGAAMPQSYLERMYGSRFACHFYSEEERARFAERWGGGPEYASTAVQAP